MALLAAALALLLLAWGILAGAVVAGRRARGKRDERLRLVEAPDQALAAPVKDGAAAAGVPSNFDRRWRAFFAYRIARNWAMRSGGIYLLAVGVLLGGLAWLLFSTLLHFQVAVSVPLALAMFFLGPRALLKREQNRTEQMFLNGFPDAIDMVIRMLRAGLPISSAVRAVGTEGPKPVNEVFRTIGEQMDIGIPLDDALLSAGERIGMADFRFFTVAVALQHSTGGNLATTLETIGEIMRKRRAMRMKGQATTGEVRVSAYILGGLPFLVTGVLLLINPSYLAPLISDRRGNAIVGIALCSLMLGFMTMRRMMRSLVEK
jgi:tight adherence protein B